jgi:hypothetical protein
VQRAVALLMAVLQRRVSPLGWQIVQLFVFCVDLRTNSDYFPIQH